MSAIPLQSILRPEQITESRKRSFVRVLDKFKTAFRRKDSSISLSRADQPCTPNELNTTPITSIPWLLTADSDDESSDLAEEPLFSLGALGRRDTGIAEARTRQFFEHHGLTYNTRRPSDTEPAAKLRRVERPVRMRVRWTCHSCRTVYGADKFCPGCGHRRCLDCTRDPSRKMKLGESQARTSATAIVMPQSTDDRPISVGSGIKTTNLMCKPQQQWQCTIQIGRPRTEPHLHKTSTHSRRKCHECDTILNSTLYCSNCQHSACALCPMAPTLTTRSTAPLPSTVSTVERVYKKPRQRVRYNCENCSLLFTDRHKCSGCGHERCESCPRFPPRKHKPVVDPTLWTALEARITEVTRDQVPALVADEPTLLHTTTALARL